MQDTLTFPTLGSPPKFAFPDPHYDQFLCSEFSSSTSTPFVSAPSSPSRMKGFYFSAPTSPTWAQRTLQMQDIEVAGSTDLAQGAPQQVQEIGSPKWALKAPEMKGNGSPDWAQKTQQMKDGGSPNWAQKPVQVNDGGSTNWAQKPVQVNDGGSTNWAQKSLQMNDGDNLNCTPKTLQMKDDSSSNWVQKPHPMKNDAASHKALRMLEIEDVDAAYTRKSFYASAIPFAWEEKPGTPKTRANCEANNGEEDSSSILLSGSSEFEFSARFSEMEDPPMSPTPISSSFKQHTFGNFGPNYELAYGNPNHNEVPYGQQERPLRPPPRLDIPMTSVKQLIKDEAAECKHSFRSLSSLSTPQSPHSPSKFGLRGILCGISNPADTVFDPFLAAMEKMAKSTDDLVMEEMAKDVKKNTRASHGHHRRTQSSSPLRIFHWDEHSSKSNSSSNDSFMDEIKDIKHPIHKEINARHGSSSSKGSKRWSVKGFLHRKSINNLPAEAGRSSNTTSLRSSGRSSCSSSMGESNDVNLDDNAKARGVNMDDNARVRRVNVDDNAKVRGVNSPGFSPYMPSLPLTLSSSSSSSSGNSSRGKLSAHKATKGAYAVHYTTQRAQTEELRKRTFLPYKQGLLGCLGFSSKSYKAIATLSKPLQSVT